MSGLGPRHDVLPCAGVLEEMASRGPFQPQLPCDSATCKDARIMINTELSILALFRRDIFDFPLFMPFQSHGIRNKCGLTLTVQAA